MRSYVFALVGILGSSACQLFDPVDRKYADLLSRQSMVINPYSPEHASRHGPGFAITMKREEVKRLGAPNSNVFKEELEKYLADERARGRDYCPHGYNIVDVVASKHWYTEIGADCKSK